MKQARWLDATRRVRHGRASEERAMPDAGPAGSQRPSAGKAQRLKNEEAETAPERPSGDRASRAKRPAEGKRTTAIEAFDVDLPKDLANGTNVCTREGQPSVAGMPEGPRSEPRPDADKNSVRHGCRTPLSEQRSDRAGA